ncbi:D-alanyl-D-alanine carboxypeptidase/D-alanyl-D-alanine endopeptidase [Dyadobacter fanqingshengii]|uniref:D-alanyl-D-alanine carboxypeptidase/D-alanyl-D-alanine-endopeptidase n=1 Tax=Dyadobacter fanqingshengii TaxID=2906443 RepID=A0A9X1PET5_9BACT|nr:D-alanyl-D-alanine carboxypeptidase/D-alanyl-D-alanine-endopeptidase [Dyadobacter fanqingshengii]MCF0043676.1 D-alanyl-D-alanine carboxypeptidase/D-alanyl-D-alanine-endopeptidase [Dyadobacter fanqingshengii]USJ34952.1 D-alanyl-D-alanine carboxypeptidase/D-alanyl-D-alanine-endopeptidase [Dyadobacter fanqingshengii]
MRTLIFFGSVLMLSGCSVSHYLKRELKNSTVLSQQHTGVSIQKLGEKKELAAYQSNKYYNPASNTKLFSYYAGLCALGDSIPGLEYLEWGELLIIRGTGDPSFLHPDLPKSKVFEFLKNRKEPIFFTAYNFENKRFGPGWAWGDYNDYYQPEVSPLPVYGNIARFSGNTSSGETAERFQVAPAYWNKAMVLDTAASGIEREEGQNLFHHSRLGVPQGLIQDVPVRMTDAITVQLLSDTLKKEIKLINIPLEIELKKVNSIPSDSLYKRMMQVSDNMLAEQLMLLYASANGLPLNTEKAIAHAIEHHMSDLPDKPVWKDGSGLSRYNLFTPRTITTLLQKIHQKVPQEKLFQILPAGGKSGTLNNLFKSNPPFIFAKTGSLSNNFCLSGYLITKEGKTLVFSFMNNNFTRPTGEIRKEVERILTGLHDKF